MAYAGPLLTRRRVLAASVETTPGTAEVLAAADGVFNVFDASMQADMDFEDRLGQVAFGRLPSIAGARGATCTFAIELHGSGTGGSPVPAWASVFFPACGMVADGGAFAPSTLGPDATGAVKSLTLGLYEDGIYKKMTGAMGNAVFQFAAGKVVRVEFTFSGIWCAPTDVAVLAPNYPAIKPLRFADASMTIASWAPKIADMSIDLGNEVVLREDANQAAGYITAIVTDRRVNGSLNSEAALVATQNSYGQWLASTEQALALSLGATAGNVVAFAAPKLQFLNVQEGDRNGIHVDDITFQCNRSADAGDDEFTVTFT